MNGYVQITATDLILAGLLMLINIGLSALLRLGMGRRLLVAATRMIVQLLLIGSVLEWVFSRRDPYIILAMAVFMASIAGIAAVQRTARRFKGIFWNSLVTVLFSSFFVTGVALIGVIDIRPWYDPQYLIPLLGMVLGNTLNGISLGLDRFMSGVEQARGAIETRLCLGATRWEAAHELIRDALRTGMIPTVNSMMVMGLVSLPGMMTGQILAGADPEDAVRYQIAIMFMIVAGTALGALGTVLLAFSALFSSRHRLRLESLSRVRE